MRDLEYCALSGSVVPPQASAGLVRGRPRAAVPTQSNHLGVGAAVDGEIGAGDVGGFGAGDEGDQGGDLFHCAVALEGGVGVLRRGPVAGGGIEVGVDRAGLDVVDGDAASADFSGRPWVNIFTAPLVAA